MGDQSLQIHEQDTPDSALPEQTTEKIRPSSEQEAGLAPQLLGISGSDSPDDISLNTPNLLWLQRAIGNRRVYRIIQTKLRISQPGDPYEREADRIAEQILQPHDSLDGTHALPDRIHIQRANEDELRKRPEDREFLRDKPRRNGTLLQWQETADDERRRRPEEGALIQGSSKTGGVQSPARNFEQQLYGLRRGGEPLPESDRSFFEPRFGADFSQVRIHKGPQADAMAKQVHARAFTTGRDIVFGAGEYAPDSPGGQKLLAHELTHVVHQNSDMSPGRSPAGQLHRSERGVIQRGLLGDIWSGVKSVGSSIGEAGAWVGEKAVGVAESAWEGAKWVGEKVGEGAKWAGGQLATFGKRAWECAKATGRSVWNIVNLRVTSVSSLLGIPEPTEGSPGTLDTILRVARHPCLMMIPGYSLLTEGIQKLDSVRAFLHGAWKLMQNPGLIFDGIRMSLGGMVAKIPDKAREIARGAITFSDPLKEHLDGIWRHLEPKLAYLAGNWWQVIKEAAWDLLWPWPGVWEDMKTVWSLLKSSAGKLWDLDFSGALDDLLAIWRTVNALLGRLYGWFFIASVLVGAIIGAFFGGAGAIPGAAAGAKFALVVGEYLVFSVLAAETVSIGKAGFDLVFTDQTEEEQEEDYEQIANSGLTLAIIGVMFLIGAIAVRFARGLIARVRGLFKKKPKTKAEKLEALKAKRAEKARAKEIEEGIKKLDDEINAGKKTLPKEDLDWLNADPTGRRKELAFDKEIGNYRVNEAKAALKAEQQGALSKPVRRATSGGDDFIDGAGRVWDHKWVDPKLGARDAAQEIINLAKGGENILADLTSMNPAQASQVRLRVNAMLPGTKNVGNITFVPGGASATAVGAGVTGEKVGEQVEEK